MPDHLYFPKSLPCAAAVLRGVRVVEAEMGAYWGSYCDTRSTMKAMPVV
jgi:hypothetical protein